MAAERHFRAMGTDAHVIVVGGPEHLADAAVDRIEQLEARWSRFRPTSEISRLNEAGGAAVEVSLDTTLLVRRAIVAWEISAGFVDCTQLTAVIAAGYDRSYDQLPADRPAPAAPTAAAIQLTAPPDIDVDGTTVRLPAGVGFDPGGIGKGLAADLVSEELIDAGAEGVCVNLGGDLRVHGSAPDDAWTIAIDHPHRPEPVALVGLAEGAVATSTTLCRTWKVGGDRRHHLIDPRTGEPSTSDLALVSAIAGEAWMAETMAKAVLLRGGAHPFDLVDGSGVEVLTVALNGQTSASDGFRRFLGEEAPAR